MSKKITLWFCYNKKTKRFDYNHYEIGWSQDPQPFQVRPGGNRWAKEFAHMEGTTVKHMDE